MFSKKRITTYAYLIGSNFQEGDWSLNSSISRCHFLGASGKKICVYIYICIYIYDGATRWIKTKWYVSWIDSRALENKRKLAKSHVTIEWIASKGLHLESKDHLQLVFPRKVGIMDGWSVWGRFNSKSLTPSPPTLIRLEHVAYFIHLFSSSVSGHRADKNSIFEWVYLNIII